MSYETIITIAGLGEAVDFLFFSGRRTSDDSATAALQVLAFLVGIGYLLTWVSLIFEVRNRHALLTRHNLIGLLIVACVALFGLTIDCLVNDLLPIYKQSGLESVAKFWFEEHLHRRWYGVFIIISVLLIHIGVFTFLPKYRDD